MKKTHGDIDFVARFIEIVKEKYPPLTVDEAKTIESKIREELGGNKYYIPKKTGQTNMGAANGLTVKEIQERLGVSRTHAYRLYRQLNKTI